ncbi:hypothetical protein RhiirA1_436092 [Rhizophagus irregularis]|uniref:Uncharacterized protein n=1 Tax=Rhizophagus irregularis TaxID=588596 RepID=A0A2N0SJ92_9GLOM|nr:hypothetical protein RhiirA1_436092 [Rhizophagus irregularis]
MAALIPFVPPPPPVFQWTINATRQLIAERRNIHQQFERISNRHHICLDESIDGSMLRMIDVDMNIDCEGKEGGRDLGLDQEVEIEVEIEDETEVEIEDGIEVEIEEEVEAGPHIEDKDIKF